MVWDKNNPQSSTKVKLADNIVRDNFAYLESTVEDQHQQLNESNSGQEIPGKCSVVKVDTFANIDALTDIEGGLAFATDYWDYLVNSGSGWIRRRGVPQGTRCVFRAIVAPTGWTAVTSSGLGDAGFIITKSSAQGGSTGGTITAGSWTISGVTHPHTHEYSDVLQHQHDLLVGNGVSGGGLTGLNFSGLKANVYARRYTENEGVSPPATSEQPGDATVSSNGLWRPKGMQYIVCEKD
jgi:hypothetical protein